VRDNRLKGNNMDLNINNPTPIPAAAPVVLGAAVKIIFSGGSRLSVADQARASGVSPYIWQDQKRKICDMVRKLEGEG